MEKSVNNKIIYLRESTKYKPVIERVRQIAPQFHNELTATIMELLKLGIKSYDSGLRVVEDKVINVNEHTSTMNVRREVGRSVFTSLAGSLVDIGRKEEAKPNPDKSKLDFYQLARKALYAQHAKFRHLTDADVEEVFLTLSPILKGLRLTDSNQESERIINDNKSVLDNLINKTGVTNGI